MVSQFTFRSESSRSGRRRMAYASILVLVILALDIISGGGVRSLAQRVMSSLWAGSERARSAIFGSGYFSTQEALARENAALREQLERNTERAAAYQILKNENDVLRSLLHLAQQEKGITAPIVSSVRSSPYGTFVIGAGVADAVETGSLVVTEGGFVVGTVSDVDERTSTAVEVFAGGATIDVRIKGATASAEGRGGGNARVLIPRGVEIQIGDAVVAPELGGRAVGLVGEVDSDPSSASQTVYVSLPVNLASLSYVYVIPPR